MRFLLPLLAACTPAAKDTAPKDTDTGGADSGVDSDSGVDTVDTGETADTGETGVPEDACTVLGLTPRAWDPSGVGDFDTVAPDFTVTLLDGSTWTWSEHYSGCESVVAVTWMPDYDYPNLDRVTDIRDWLEASPLNVHYLIYADTTGDRTADVTRAGGKIDNAIDGMESAEAQAWWHDHVHYVVDDPYGDGWIGTLNQTYRVKYPVAWGIDRFQRVRELGYLSDPTTGWAETPPSFLNYEVRHFEMEASRQERLDAEGATVLRVFDAAPQSSGWATTVEFPDAATMAGFDRLEIDLTEDCGGHPDAEHCGEWDYLTYAYLCPVDDVETPDVDESSASCTEFGRFITSYARPGRWVVDASPFLALLQDGGPRVVRFGSSNAYVLTMDLRLSDTGSGYRPFAMSYLWSGGGFNESYNDAHPDIAFTPPEGTDRVDVMGIITGHGYGKDRANCAEFCNHQHEFTLNDAQSWMKEEPEAGSSYGCGDHVVDQALPNQYGTWVYGRGGWCPGMQVDPWSADVSGAVDLGGENVIRYRGLFQGAPYVPEPYDSGSGFGADIDAATWLVYYRAM